MKRWVIAAAVAVTVALGLTACLGRNAPLPAPTVAVPTYTPSPTPSPRGTPAADGFGSVNVAAVLDEYDAAAIKYADDLPDGYIFPAEYPQGISFEWAPAGTGEVTALAYWRCAWTDQFLVDFDAKDTVAIDRDLDTLDTWPEFAALEHMYLDDPDQWQRDVMEPAREGHISLLRTFGRAGCVPVKADGED
jgi:hypothetical protein